MELNCAVRLRLHVCASTQFDAFFCCTGRQRAPLSLSYYLSCSIIARGAPSCFVMAARTLSYMICQPTLCHALACLRRCICFLVQATSTVSRMVVSTWTVSCTNSLVCQYLVGHNPPFTLLFVLPSPGPSPPAPSGEPSLLSMLAFCSACVCVCVCLCVCQTTHVCCHVIYGRLTWQKVLALVGGPSLGHPEGPHFPGGHHLANIPEDGHRIHCFIDILPPGMQSRMAYACRSIQMMDLDT